MKFTFKSLSFLLIAFYPALSAALTASLTDTRHEQSFQVCGLTSVQNQVLIMPMKYHGWKVSFEMKDGHLGVFLHDKEEITAAVPVMENVRLTLTRPNRVKFDAQGRFPAYELGENINKRYTEGWGKISVLDLSKYQDDCAAISVSVTYDKAQAEAVNEFFGTRRDSIGELDDEDLEEMEPFYQTELKFKTDDDKVLDTVKIDVLELARLSRYFRAHIRNDGQLVCHNSMTCKYFNEEVVHDLTQLIRRKRFTTKYFAQKTGDYLIRMAYIADQFQMTKFKHVIEDAIMMRLKEDLKQTIPSNELLLNAAMFAAKTDNDFINRLLPMLDHPEGAKHRNDLQQLKDLLMKHHEGIAAKLVKHLIEKNRKLFSSNAN